MSKVLSVTDLRVRFRVKSAMQAMFQRIEDPFIDAVRQVSFDIEEGQTFTLVGESGSGKSTLALAVAGLLPSAEGRIEFLGKDVTNTSAPTPIACSNLRSENLSPFGVSIQILPPPPPQHRLFSRDSGISFSSKPGICFNASRGSSNMSLCRPR